MTTYIIIHIICGIISYGGIFAYVQKEFESIARSHYRENMAMSAMTGFFGPIGLIVVFFNTGFFKHGFKFW